MTALPATGIGNLGALCRFKAASHKMQTQKYVSAAMRYDAIFNRFFAEGMRFGAPPAQPPHLPPDCAKDFLAITAPLAGYFAGSAFDNSEWAAGYEKRFGLVPVEFESLQRPPTASYHAVRQALEC